MQEVLLAATYRGADLGGAEAARTLVPVSRRLQIAVLGNVARELGGRHHHEADAVLDERLANVVAAGQHLVDQVTRFEQAVIGDLRRAEDGKPVGNETLLIEVGEAELLADGFGRRSDPGLVAMHRSPE